MKKLLILPFLGLVLFTACSSKDEDMAAKKKLYEAQAVENAEIFTVNTETSSMTWLAKKVTGQHNGTIKIAQGELSVKDNEVKGGQLNIDMNSLTILDLTDEKSNTGLLKHLRSEDFFSIEKYSQATFQITKVEKIKNAETSKPNYQITGNLTIKNITNEITFPADIHVVDNTLTAKANFEIDRTRWDIRYGSGKFFENLGDKLVYDNFAVGFDLQASK